jgi:Group II intron, maturase-specific domain
MWGKGEDHFFAHSFQPAASPKALTSIGRTIRRWTLHHRSDKDLRELAKMYNPYIQGGINYYGNFYRTQLLPTLKRIDAYVIRWARRKFKRLRHHTKGVRDWFAQLRCANPKLFAHWQLCHGNGRTTGPYGSRGSRTVLGEPGDESPPGHSTVASFWPSASHFRFTPISGWSWYEARKWFSAVILPRSNGRAWNASPTTLPSRI